MGGWKSWVPPGDTARETDSSQSLLRPQLLPFSFFRISSATTYMWPRYVQTYTDIFGTLLYLWKPHGSSWGKLSLG